jgi:predicted ribosome quality control (RQC) complex YloA/Tae2 family protein
MENEHLDKPLDHRVLRLEYIIQDHDEELKELKDNSEDLREALNKIELNLKQIKWFAMGASALYFADSFGLTAMLKILGA